MLAQQNAQQAQQIEQMQAGLQKLGDELRTKTIEAEYSMRIEQMKIESSDRQTALKAQVDLVKVEAQLTSAENIALLKSQVSDLQRQIAAMSSGAAAEAAEPAGPGDAMAGSRMPPPGMPMGGTAAGPAAPPQF
jgi:hypothetical protein